MNRKDFLRASGIAGLGAWWAGQAWASGGPVEAVDFEGKVKRAGIDGSAFDLAAEPLVKVRVTVVGCGNRGETLIDMLRWLTQQGHCEVVAVADVDAAKAAKAAEQVRAFQGVAPATFSGTTEVWKEAVRAEVADLALICTPWELHPTMALHAMRAGVHAASEVPLAYRVEDCLELVRTCEETRRHCIMLENCCYNEEELWVLRMIEEGVFGTVTHAECAYIHDLRVMLLDPTYYAERWRLMHHLKRNGNPYTTHGLGPVCMYMDILRGDTLTHLVSMGSKEAALSEALAASGDDTLVPLAKQVRMADVNSTLIGTASGRSILLQHDSHSGRPYTRLNKVVGSKAVHYGYPSRLYIDNGPTWQHDWLPDLVAAEYVSQYEHPVWTKLRQNATEHEHGHGGMDFVMMYRLIRSLNLGLPLDLNVYDGALQSLVGALTEVSVAAGSARVDIPDLTAGRWRERRTHGISLRSAI